MRFEDISVPEAYLESNDFRLFLNWIWNCLHKFKYDTEHLIDIYDPMKCREELLWMLGDTIGYKFDDRLPTSFNRLVILNFMNMIKKKGSKSGVTFAAELNLAQFNLISYGSGYEDEDGNVVPGKEILYNRLEDTSVPVNAVYVNPNVGAGYIDVVYFSTDKPIDACIEYVRPLGMYLFQHPGVDFNARTQISIDARLTNTNELFESIRSTRVADYTRDDYARGQRVMDNPKTFRPTPNGLKVTTTDTRDPVYYRNKDYEGLPNRAINPGFRALHSLQLCNNEHVVKSLIDPMFSLGFGPQSDDQTYSDEPYYITEDNVTVVNPKSYLVPSYSDEPAWNLRYDRQQELSITHDITTLDESRDQSITDPHQAVNPIMKCVGDAIEISPSIYTESDGNSIKSEIKGDM